MRGRLRGGQQGPSMIITKTTAADFCEHSESGDFHPEHYGMTCQDAAECSHSCDPCNDGTGGRATYWWDALNDQERIHWAMVASIDEGLADGSLAVVEKPWKWLVPAYAAFEATTKERVQ